MDDAARIGPAWRELRRGASMTALRERMQGETGLDLGQIDTLEHLVTSEGWRMSELADALRVDASTATRAVSRLADVGLAERVTCAHDAGGRQPAGRDARAAPSVLEAEQRALADGMERLVAAVDAMAAETVSA